MTKGLIIILLTIVGVSLLVRVSHAHDGLVEEIEEDRVLNQWAVKLVEGEDAEKVAEEHGVRLVKELRSLPGVYLFEAAEGKQSAAQSEALKQSPKVRWAKQQVARKRYKRSRFQEPVPDPYYPSQWHLHDHPYSINAPPAWDAGFTGAGVTVAIVDDGLEWDHPDLRENYDADASWDVNYEDGDPRPSGSDAHGTESAGCAAAVENSVCGVGSAPDATLSGIRLLGKAATDAEEAEGLAFGLDKNDVYSCSWGPTDDGRRLEGPEPLCLEAIQRGASEGRNGLGAIYVWAGGNGRTNGDNCNYDGYANMRETIPIGALGSDGKFAYYSEPCSGLFAVAPSSSRSGNKITTTNKDLSGRHQCSTSFGGTSAAAPIMAGAVALVLQANPGLSWRDVQGVIAESAVKVHSTNDDWQVNAAGLHYNHNYGFGRADALKMVTAAQQWINYGPVRETTVSTETIDQVFDNNGFAGRVTVEPPVEGSVHIIEHIQLSVNIEAVKRGKVTISITSPSGVVSRLQEEHGDYTRNINWTYITVAHWGEPVDGDWTITLFHTSGSYTGTLHHFDLRFFSHLAADHELARLNL